MKWLNLVVGAFRRRLERSSERFPFLVNGQDVVAVGLCVLLWSPQVCKAQSDDARDVGPWYLDNVLSTSMETPSAALQVPVSETVPVRGRILTADGLPAAGAEVWAASVFCSPPIREKTVTDENGYFLLHLKPLRGKSDRWSISAYQSDSSVVVKGGQEWIDEADPKQPQLIVGRLVPRQNMICRIMTKETGEPIRDARVFVGDGRVLVSDGNGEIVVAGLKHGSHPIVVVAQGRVRRRVIFDNTLRREGVVEITLEQAGQVRGQVVDAEGTAIPYAWIKSPGSGRAMTLDGNCALADSKGNFVWDGVPYNSLLRLLRFGAEGFETDSIPELIVSPDKLTTVVARLHRQADETRVSGIQTLSLDQDASPMSIGALGVRDLGGIVIDPRGLPVADALVRWGATAYEEVDREVQTDTKGAFRLESVPDRVGYVTIMADGYAPRFEKIEKGELTKVITVHQGDSLGGKVLNYRGESIAGVQVIPMISSPDPALCNPLWITQRSTRTDENGRFSLKWLPKTNVYLDFLHEEYTESRSVLLEKGKMDHEVRLSARGGFRGRVVDSDGDPIRNYRITLDFPRQRRNGERIPGFSVVYRGIGVSYTDDDGQFCFGSAVAPGAPYRIMAHADGFQSTSIDRVIPTTLDRLNVSTEHEFKLIASNELVVKTINAITKQPIQSANVTVYAADPEEDQAVFHIGSSNVGKRFNVSGADGITRHENLAIDQGAVLATAEGYAHQRFPWRNDEQGFVVEMVPETILRGRVVTEQGRPLTNLWISTVSEDLLSQATSLRPSSNGVFEFQGLLSGKQTLSIHDELNKIYEDDLRLRAGQHFEMELVVDSQKREVVRVKKSRRGKALSEEVRAKVTADSELQ